MIEYTRLKNLILVILVNIYSLFRGTANKTPKIPPKKVVIIYLTNNIGDMIFATPIFRALKVKYPEVNLTVVGSPKNKLVLESNNDVDHYLPCTKNIRTLITDLKKINADYGITVSSSSLDMAMMFIAGIPSIAAFEVKNISIETSSYKAIKRLFIRIPYYIGKYVAEEYLRLLEPLNIYSKDSRKHLGFTKQGEVNIKNFFSENNIKSEDRIAIFSPGAGTKIKQWPAERFAEVADHIYENNGMKIAVIGGPGDREETNNFIRSLKKPKPLIFVDSSLDDLKAFISQGKLLVANDSGPVYIAEAFNIPTLVVVGPTNENEHPPKGQLNRIVTAKNREQAVLTGHSEIFDKEKARQQIMDVEVNDVLEEINDLIYTMKN